MKTNSYIIDMPPQLTVKAPGQRRRGGHSSGGSGRDSRVRDSRVSQEAGYLLQLQIDGSSREQAADSTYRPSVKATDAVGTQFNPFHVPERDFCVRQPLPSTPLGLFQQFLPEHIVKHWAQWTNEAKAPKPGPARTNGSYHRQDKWTPTSIPEVYLWLGILIYISLHREKRFEDHWKASTPDRWVPDHPIRDFMPYDRFLLLKRRLRIYDPDCIEIAMPAPFNKVNEWSHHIMETAIRLVEVGSVISVDEAIVGFKGRSRHKVTIKNKPTPTGLKVWALATQGYLLQWFWHQPGPGTRPQTIALNALNALVNGLNSLNALNALVNGLNGLNAHNPDSIIYSSSSEDSADDTDDTDEADEEALEIEALDETASQPTADIIAKLPPLNPTQAVVVALVSRLPSGTYHVIVDNLFSSPDLFRALRILGIGATGTCCTNCGLFRDIIVAKKNDEKGRQLWPWGQVRTWPTVDNKVGRSSKTTVVH
ncbi:PiggyBac transposable element-derived protein 4 [Paramyrothecium foliicola]|nr:PiggyBac transposable element-derived protein 4 [Paramyrothecium foliicola]